MLPIRRSRADLRLKPFLPSAVNIETLLRSKTECAIFPSTVLQQSKLFTKLPHQSRFGARNRQVMSRPGISGDFILAPARIAARLRFRFEQDEVLKPALLQTPGGAESRHAA